MGKEFEVVVALVSLRCGRRPIPLIENRSQRDFPVLFLAI
jgi:hypothetical protein